ncbi:MAG TPA: response regulator transcription factor [Chitinophagaceae bacterium]|jgi:DNA-binding response OmpR family regulator|nr:response regulator transcription factor [Chitinophagaceae bacterium]
MPKILLIEDEALLGKIVKESLEVRGFDMFHATDGAEGLKRYRELNPDLIVLDIMMPQMDGITLAKEIRRNDKQTPIIFLTAKSQTTDVVKGFESGGNDYLKKPFSMDELIVRIKELLNRNSTPAPMQSQVFRIGNYSFDYEKQSLKYDGETYLLSHREGEILMRLCMHQNKVLERREVLMDLWGDDSFFNARSMDVFISKLRRYLKDDPGVQIVNIRGVGYKLIC